MVKIVLDSNILLAQVISLDYSNLATEKFRQWVEQDTELFIPTLALYEVTSALRKAMVVQQLSNEQVIYALQNILALEIQTVAPTPELLEKGLEWAVRINQTVAYDGTFLAVAESLQAHLWTADRRLAESTQTLGITWVRFLQEEGDRL